MRRTAIELYAGGLYLAVVMPNGDRSFYSDLRDGSRYFAYLTEELPALMESYFPLSRERSGRFGRPEEGQDTVRRQPADDIDLEQRD